MKKIFSAIVSFLLIFCILSDIAAMAAMPEGRDVAIWVDDASVTAGDTFTVAVQARALENIATLSLVLYYNSSYFELVSAHPQSMITSNSGDMNSINSQTEGKVRVMCTVMGGNVLSTNGVSDVLTFRIKDDAKAGSYPLDLLIADNADSIYIINPDNTMPDVPCKLSGGSVTVQ
jgi:hypothetical protein